jgi:hypothetical protein
MADIKFLSLLSALRTGDEVAMKEQVCGFSPRIARMIADSDF